MLVTARTQLTRALVRLWPTYIGVEHVMNLVRPPIPLAEYAVTKLSGYPIRIKYDPRTFMGLQLYYRGIYEGGVLRKLRQLLKPGMVFVDVGANIGLYSLVAAHCTGKTGRVVAIEPQPALAEYFHENMKMNGYSHVSLKPVAVGKEPGLAQIVQVSRTNNGQATLQVNMGERVFGHPVSVRVERMTDLLNDRQVAYVDGMKIDTEGAEVGALEGFREWLERKPPRFILVECIEEHLRRFGNTSEDLFRLLEQFGYDIFCLYRGRWRSLSSKREHGRCGFSPDLLALRRN